MKYDRKVSSSRSQKNTGKYILFTSVLIIFVLFSAAVGAGLGMTYAFYRDLPSLAPLEDYTSPKWDLPTKVYDADGKLLATFSEEKREIVQIEELPPELIEATIAIEDNRFFRHRGVDFYGILRAAYRNLKAGRIVEGGSTITQQLAKLLFLTPKQTLRRKLREALLALKIERNYTKREILERYFNKIYFGGGAYGVETASQLYFNKSAREINAIEAAFLAGLPRAPSRYSPLRNPEKARERHKVVVQQMVKRDLLEQKQALQRYEKFWNKFDRRQLKKEERKEEQIRSAPYYVEHVRQLLLEKFGSDVVYRGGLEVHTSLNTDYQEILQEKISQYLLELNKNKKNLPDTATEIPKEPPAPIIEGASIVRDPQNGKILAMVGGHRWHSKNQLNRAVQSHRQPGSAFKPILYSAAIDEGYTPVDRLQDMPLRFNTPQGEWHPQNYGGKFHGEVLLRDALANSLNVATIDLMSEIGSRKFIDYAHKLGIESELKPHLSLALGGLGQGTSLLEMSRVYGSFANLGIRTNDIFITEIKDREGNVLERNFSRQRKALSPRTAFLVTDLLKTAVEEGTGRYSVGRHFKRPVAGKTGTTDNYRDAWFIGYTPELVIGSWFGYDMNNRSLGEGMSGGAVAGTFWTRVAEEIYSDKPIKSFPVPNGITFVSIDPETGFRATPRCPQTERVPFQTGRAPTKPCPKHGSGGIYARD